MTNYASLQEMQYQEEAGIMYHRPEPTRSKWNHIVDLDSFFRRVYRYHQQHGFLCMLLQEVFKLNQFVFVISLSLYLIHGINYQILFDSSHSSKKATLRDVVLPVGQCIANFTTVTWFFTSLAIMYLILKVIIKFYHLICFWDIKQFYNIALGIEDKHLDNITWHAIQSKLKIAQLEHQMCIHKMELTELDIYHRILRHKNYLVALVNKRILPPRIYIPFLGETVYWTKSLQYDIEALLFWSPFCLFGNNYEQHPDFKKAEKRHILARQFSKYILYLALINLLLAPVVLVWRVIYTFFHYAELIKREPSKIGIRNWSLYGKLYVRHFNELDHELKARLARAYRPMTRYMAAFTTPVGIIIAQHVEFLCGALFAVIVGLTIYDEDVLAVENVLTLMTILGAIIAICRGIIPEQTVIYCPETLLQEVVMHTHYLPPNWRENAHSSEIRSEVQQIFQYRFVSLLEEVFSAFLTPYVLLRWIHPRSLDIVDFLRNFTVYVDGVGNVCSFAEMDVVKHGDPDWQKDSSVASLSAIPQSAQAEDGKIEMSLIHFATTNPTWVPPSDAQQFVNMVQEELTPMYQESEAMFFTSNLESYSNFNIRSVANVRKSRMAGRGSYPPFGTYPHRKSLYISEGPDIYTSISMTNNMMALHNMYVQKQEEKRFSASAEESTPLLSKDDNNVQFLNNFKGNGIWGKSSLRTSTLEFKPALLESSGPNAMSHVYIPHSVSLHTNQEKMTLEQEPLLRRGPSRFETTTSAGRWFQGESASWLSTKGDERQKVMFMENDDKGKKSSRSSSRNTDSITSAYVIDADVTDHVSMTESESAMHIVNFFDEELRDWNPNPEYLLKSPK